MTRHAHGKYHRHSKSSSPATRHTLMKLNLGPLKPQPGNTTSLGRGGSLHTQVADPAPRLDDVTSRASVKKDRTKALGSIVPRK